MNSSKLLSFVFASLLAAPSLAKTLTQPTQLTNLTYDYIIVGAGNAGLVVANRLTEDPNVSVLVLEAGVSDDGVVPIQAPFLGPTLTPDSQFDWNYTVTAQAGMNGRSFSYPRGKVLGGSSSVNYLFHQFGTNEDWNRLGSVSGDAGWSWANMKKYVQSHERFVPPIDGHNTTDQFIPSLHGFKGQVSVTLPGFNYSIDSRIMNVTQQLPEFPFNQDLSGGEHSMLGLGWVQTSAGGGVRSSSSSSYLASANSRPNLTVLINATVMKLLQTVASSKGVKAFRTVQFTNTPGTGFAPASKIFTVSARKDVILSAGSVGSTQILQLSGIGNAAELQALNITTTINNPDVGENLSDHTLLPNIFSVQGTSSLDGLLKDPTEVQDTLNQYVQNKTGVFANNIANNFGFLRLPSNSSIFQTTPDPAAGPGSPHWEIINSDFYLNPGIARPDSGDFMTVVAVLISPTSRGSIKLSSSNPFDKPTIDPKYLSTDFDIFAMRETVKAVKRYAAAPAFSDYVIGPYGTDFAAANDDASIDAYVRGLTTTIFHPTGTASMSSSQAKSGVVNPDLKVKGTEGLRVVDASVFPFIPSCHTQGPVYLLAERASDIIKSQA